MIELDRVKEYLKIDFDDSDMELIDLIKISEIYVDEMVGINYKTNDKLLKLADIAKLNIIQNLYDNRNDDFKTNKIVNSILNRLALESKVD